MQADEQKEKQAQALREEVAANRSALYVNIFVFAFTLVIGIRIDSITLLLSSSAWLVDVVATVMYHRIIISIHKEPDARYHFGYAKYEPLVAVVTGLLIVSSCVLSIKYAVQDIVHPEEVHSYALGVALAGATAVVSLGLGRHLQRLGKRLKSAILVVNAADWYVDGLLSAGICAGFLAGKVVSELGHSQAAAYMDPAMSIVLAGLLLITPIQIIRDNMDDLLDANPGQAIERTTWSIMDRLKDRFPFGRVHRIRLRKAGRKVFLDIRLACGNHCTAQEQSRLVQELRRDADKEFEHVDVTVSFEAPDR